MPLTLGQAPAYFLHADSPDGSRLNAYVFRGTLNPDYPFDLSVTCRYPDGTSARHHDSACKTLDSVVRKLERLAPIWHDDTTYE